MDCPHIPQIPYHEFSEMIYDKVSKRRIPISGSMELTFGCNLDCVHCYCDHGMKKNEMKFRDVCRILDEMADAGCLWLLLTGGEPLLREDFLDIYAYAKKRGMIISLFTNGTLISPYIADFLEDLPPFMVEISLYGMTPRTYEKISRVSGSFDRCLKGINFLLERGLPVTLKTMLMSMNKKEIPAMKKYAAQLGVKFRFDPFLNPRLDRSLEPCSFRVKPEEVLEFDLADKERKAGWKDFCEKFPAPADTDLLYSCSAGRSSFHIDPAGNLGLCVISRYPNYNLKTGTFEEGWLDAVPRLIRQKKTFAYECAGCELRDLCAGCPGWSELETGNPEMPVEYLCRTAHLRAKAFAFGRYAKKTAVRTSRLGKAAITRFISEGEGRKKSKKEVGYGGEKE
ncbi:MAG: radical SAM protein [Candidatus Omnitrophica bacterium]|nr:radical SAM protein [Candidatus Omnitrophota bacterium]MBU4479633.1 radical SAM protein [Candidatus Omnitrophota bacterium]MCG2703539.1 radical SAM protein [Candidatus Omnitrophota bacterium]